MHIAMSNSPSQVDIEAWWYNPTEEDKRLPHKHCPNRPVSLEHLKGKRLLEYLNEIPQTCVAEDLGALCWKLDVDDWQHDPQLEMIKSECGYVYWETITVAPGLLEDYEEKLQRFFHEHLHPYDESRLILEGSGYWDIRDYNGDWIRFRAQKGDMVTLPAGMYHRFTVDTNNYVKALLLFKEVSRRVDVLKPDGDILQVRKDYIESVLSKSPRIPATDHAEGAIGKALVC